MPLKTALRKTFFLPKASSRPGGQIAKMSQSKNAIARIARSAHAGWRSMNRVTPATPLPSGRLAEAPTGAQTHQNRARATPSMCILPQVSRPSFGSHSMHPNGDARGGFDRQYLLSILAAPSGTQDLGCTAVIGGRHPNIGRKKAGERALRGEPEIVADVGDRRFGGDERVKGIFHDERVEIEVGSNAGLGAE